MKIKWYIEYMNDRCEWGTSRPLSAMWGVVGRVDGNEYTRGVLCEKQSDIPRAKQYLVDLYKNFSPAESGQNLEDK